MTSGSFDEAQLGKLDEVEWTMLTPSALKPGLWENMVVCGALLSRQTTEQTPARYTQTPTACSPGGPAQPVPFRSQNGTKWAPRETFSKACLSRNASEQARGVLCMACMDGLSSHH